MGLGLQSIKLYLELYQRGFFRDINSVIDMGSQELMMKQVDFESLIRTAGISNYNRDNFTPWNWPEQPRCSSKPFFEMLGVKKYSCIDINSEHGAISIDLNSPLKDTALYGQYDLVTDHGTCEHVFNVSEAYRTMHRLCKSHGIIVISQGVSNTNGYYLFDLAFFEGIAAANNYKILFCSYDIYLKSLTAAGSEMHFPIPLSRELLDAIDWSKTTAIGITYVLQKQSDADFQYPYQDDYISQSQGHYGYVIQFLPDPPSRTYIPLRDNPMDSVPAKDLAKTLIKKIVAKIRRCSLDA